MPELPEVQTIVNFLKPEISGKKILKIESFTPRTIRGYKNISEIEKKVVGQKITEVQRVGKYVVLKLSSGEYFLFHLMMTGKLLLDPSDLSLRAKRSNLHSEQNQIILKERKHDCFVLYLSGRNKLVFNDVRKFGKCQVVSNPEKLVGADPLEISFIDFQKIFSNKNKKIKVFLLEQKYLSGIGNIYADEILWSAGVHPLRRTKNLSATEIKKIYKAMQNILSLSIQKGGTSSRNYRKPDDTEGEYYKIRKVYQRTGEKCKKCTGIIQRIILGGRATHFCPKHQR